jgi:hypothetical protein
MDMSEQDIMDRISGMHRVAIDAGHLDIARLLTDCAIAIRDLREKVEVMSGAVENWR